MSNGRVCANSNCHHTEDQHVSDMCWGKPKEIRKDGPTPGCRCNGFVARRDTADRKNFVCRKCGSAPDKTDYITVYNKSADGAKEFAGYECIPCGRPRVARRDTDTERIIGTTNILEVPKAQRWRFVSDDDGHDYLIPAEKEQEFNEWVSSFEYEPHYEGEEPQEYTGPDFETYRTSMSPNSYTFTDPKEDK